MSHEFDNDMEYDPSDVEFTEWLASKKFNYKTMDHYTMKALWTYWARGDDEVEESSDSNDEDEVAKILGSRLMYLTSRHLCNKDMPWVHERPWTKNGVWKEPTLVKHHYKPFNYKKWYEALKDRKLKEEALKNKAIMDGMIDEDNESSNEGWKRWDNFDNTDHD
nr:SGNH hydrolase-type esterase domain-containing protein [Tanacetum cinerariifolium]